MERITPSCFSMSHPFWISAISAIVRGLKAQHFDNLLISKGSDSLLLPFVSNVPVVGMSSHSFPRVRFRNQMAAMWAGLSIRYCRKLDLQKVSKYFSIWTASSIKSSYQLACHMVSKAPASATTCLQSSWAITSLWAPVFISIRVHRSLPLWGAFPLWERSCWRGFSWLKRSWTNTAVMNQTSSILCCYKPP